MKNLMLSRFVGAERSGCSRRRHAVEPPVRPPWRRRNGQGREAQMRGRRGQARGRRSEDARRTRRGARSDSTRRRAKSRSLSMQARRQTRGHDLSSSTSGGPRRAVLGVQIDPASGKDGARVLEREPGRPGRRGGTARKATSSSRSMARRSADDESRTACVVEHMRDVKPEQKVKVRVLRDGKNKDFVVRGPARCDGVQRRVQHALFRRAVRMGAVDDRARCRRFAQFRSFWPGEFGGMELASITPKLGAYFGASERRARGAGAARTRLQARRWRRDPDHRRTQARRRRARAAHPAFLQVGREAQSHRAAPAQAADAGGHHAASVRNAMETSMPVPPVPPVAADSASAAGVAGCPGGGA